LKTFKKPSPQLGRQVKTLLAPTTDDDGPSADQDHDQFSTPSPDTSSSESEESSKNGIDDDDGSDDGRRRGDVDDEEENDDDDDKIAAGRLKSRNVHDETASPAEDDDDDEDDNQFEKTKMVASASRSATSAGRRSSDGGVGRQGLLVAENVRHHHSFSSHSANMEIQLAPSETKPFTRIGSDEDEDEGDEEVSVDDPSETAVSRDAAKDLSSSSSSADGASEVEEKCKTSAPCHSLTPVLSDVQLASGEQSLELHPKLDVGLNAEAADDISEKDADVVHDQQPGSQDNNDFDQSADVVVGSA
jgi:hypothetical protein